MNKILKGCLVSIAILFGLLMVLAIAFYIYWKIPNNIKFAVKPINKKVYLKDLSFENREIPALILQQPENNIIYQAYIVDESFFNMTVIYIAAFKMEKNTKLEKSLPLNKSETDKLNQYLVLGQINNGFTAKVINRDSNKTTPSGIKMTVYSPKTIIKMNLNRGSYSLKYKEVDKVGYVSDLTLFDKETKIMYYERKRYFAFQ